MGESDTTKRIRVTKVDVLVILSTLVIAFIISLVFTENVGYSVVIAFVSALAIRDALTAPYKSRMSEKIKAMFISCLIMGFTGFAVAITFGPPGLGFAGIGSILGMLFVLGLYLISSIRKDGI